MRALIAGLACVLALAQAAPALAQADDGFCRNGLFGEENPGFGLARITGTDKARFYLDADGCPRQSAACLDKPYVLPGDRVVTGRSKAGFTCVYFPNAGGGTAGWMPAARLTALRVDPAPPLAAWLGRWNDHDNTLRFTRRRDGLWVEGRAYWPSARPDPAFRPGGPNIGTMAGMVGRTGNRGSEPGCGVTFHLLGDIIVAADPGRACDGMNVTFSGVYLRQKR
ncbi:MAG: hypothetical protein IPG83_08000 [Novosphingobium sp.]|nr:hypothetical protein [Novosphingobium sp.]